LTGLDQRDDRSLLALGVLVDELLRVGQPEVLERGPRTTHPRLARHDLLVDLRSEPFGCPGRLGADFAPARLHQLAQRLAPGLLVRRVDEHAVDIEDCAGEARPRGARAALAAAIARGRRNVDRERGALAAAQL